MTFAGRPFGKSALDRNFWLFDASQPSCRSCGLLDDVPPVEAVIPSRAPACQHGALPDVREGGHDSRACLRLACIFFALHTTSARAQAQESAAEAALASAIADYERLIKLADPVTAGQDGDREALRRSARCAACKRARDGEGFRRDRRAARAHRGAAICRKTSALNHVLLSRLVAEAVEEAPFDFGRIAFENDSGFHTLGDYLARTTTIGSRDDAEAWLARLEALPTLLRAEHREPAARRGDAIHAAEDCRRSRARRRAPARGHEGGGQPAPAAVCAHAREHSGGGAGGLSRASADARARTHSSGAAHVRRIPGTRLFARRAARASPGVRRPTARRAIASSCAARRRRT